MIKSIRSKSLYRKILVLLILLAILILPSQSATYKFSRVEGGVLISYYYPNGDLVKPGYFNINCHNNEIIMVGSERDKNNPWVNLSITKFNKTLNKIDLAYSLVFRVKSVGSDDLNSIGFGFIPGYATEYVIIPTATPLDVLFLDKNKIVIPALFYKSYLYNGGIVIINSTTNILNNNTLRIVFINNSLSTITGAHIIPGSNELLVTGSAKGRGLLAWFDLSQQNITRASLLYLEVYLNDDKNTITLSIVDDSFFVENNELYLGGRYYVYNKSHGTLKDKGLFFIKLSYQNNTLFQDSIITVSAPLISDTPESGVIKVEPVMGDTSKMAFVAPLNSTSTSSNWPATVIGLVDLSNGTVAFAKEIRSTPLPQLPYPIEQFLFPTEFNLNENGTYTLVLTLPGFVDPERGYTNVMVLDHNLSVVKNSILINRTIMDICNKGNISLSLELRGLFPSPRAWFILEGDYYVANRTENISFVDYTNISLINNNSLYIDLNPTLDIERLPVKFINNINSLNITKIYTSLNFSVFNNTNTFLLSKLDKINMNSLCQFASNTSVPVYGPSGILYGNILCSYNTVIFANTSISNISSYNYTIKFDVDRKSIIVLSPSNGVNIQKIIVNNSVICDGNCDSLFNETSMLYEFDPNTTVIIVLSPPPPPVIGGVLVEHGINVRSGTTFVVFLLLALLFVFAKMRK